MSIYRVEATFSNEGEFYGRETIYVEADGRRVAEGLAHEAVTQSEYDDPRIPDRSVLLEFEEIGRDEVPDGTLAYTAWPVPKP